MLVKEATAIQNRKSWQYIIMGYSIPGRSASHLNYNADTHYLDVTGEQRFFLN